MNLSPFQIALLASGAAILVAVWAYNRWQSRRHAPRQARSGQTAPPKEAELEPVLLEPVLEDSFETVSVPVPERKPLLDPLIDAMAALELDHPVAGEAVLAVLPATRRIGSKPFAVEGCSVEDGQWSPVQPNARYSALQCGLQLANRTGPMNEIEYSEFVVKSQALAEALGGVAQCADMLQEVARARELDQFASAHDAQLAFTLVARGAAWSPGFIQQHAARHGFVAGSLPGRLVLPAVQAGLPPVLSMAFDSQAALADEPDRTAVRKLIISLDVPQVPQAEQAFARLCDVARSLAQEMEGLMTDGAGQPLEEATLGHIAADLEQLYQALSARELPAGCAAARRLFT